MIDPYMAVALQTNVHHFPCTEYRGSCTDCAWAKVADFWDFVSYTFAPRGLLTNFLGVFAKSYTEVTRREMSRPRVHVL